MFSYAFEQDFDRIETDSLNTRSNPRAIFLRLALVEFHCIDFIRFSLHYMLQDVHDRRQGSGFANDNLGDDSDVKNNIPVQTLQNSS